MKWKKVKDEMPPLNKEILLCVKEFCGSSNHLEWFPSVIRKPAERDKMYNENYYTFSRLDDDGKYRTNCLPYYAYWLEISPPEDNDK